MHKWGWFILPALALSRAHVKQFFQKSKHIIIQICLIILITFILVEVSLRVYNYINPSFIFYSDSYNRYRGKPYANEYSDFKLNSRGFKDKEFTEKKENVYRIIGIGDSFTYGVVPYKFNYLTLLGSQLKKDNYNIEVLNMGIPCIGPKEYLSLFVKEGLELKPNMLLLTFYIGNDFSDLEKRNDIYDYSYVATFLRYLITLGTKYEGKIYNQGNYCDDKPTFNRKTYFDILKYRSFIYLKGNNNFVKLDNLALHYLSAINDICKKRNIKFIVVIAPDEFQINGVLQSELIEAFHPKLNKEKLDITLPNKELINGLNNLGITYIDLYPYFLEKSSEILYRPRDTHWNIAGNQLAANIIQAHLSRYLNDYISKSR